MCCSCEDSAHITALNWFEIYGVISKHVVKFSVPDSAQSEVQQLHEHAARNAGRLRSADGSRGSE